LRSMARRSIGLSLAALLALPAMAQSGDVALHIAPRPLAQALVQLAVQAGLSIGHSGLDFAGVSANAVEGRMAPAEALRAMLAGTGFSFVFLDAQTVRIVPAALAETAPPGPAIIEDVLVTATKRPAVAQALPASVAVIAGADLRDGAVATDTELTGHAAGLAATALGSGADKLFIRGLADSVLTGRSQAMVGVYLDESRVADDAPDPGLRLVDIDRVEILRGPQGALYGDGSLGGVVRIVTAKPDLAHTEMAATSMAAVGGRGAPSFGADAMLNLPLVDDAIGLRAVLYGQRDGGFLDDVRLGRRDVNRTDTAGGRAQLRWRPDEALTLTLQLVGQQIDAADSGYAEAGLPPYSRANFLAEPHRDRFLQASLAVEDRLEGATILSNSAVTERRIATSYDATLAWPSLTGLPAAPALFADRRGVDSLTHETRIHSTAEGSWSWVGGASLSLRDEDYTSALTGQDRLAAPYLYRSENRADHAGEGDLFGEVTYRPLDGVSLTAGLRAFYAAMNARSQIVPAASGAGAASGSNATTELTRKAALAVQADQNLLLYASATEGFRLGGININSPAGAVNINAGGGEQSEVTSATAFASDTLWTYELGAKSTLFDGRLIANTAAFLTYWDNVQSDQILANGGFYIANAGNVRAPGAELDLDWQATASLRLQANLFWSDPKIVDPNPLLIQTSGRLPGVPESSVGAHARYDFVPADGWRGFAILDYAYVGPSYAGFDAKNSPSMGDYSTLGLRLGAVCPPWQATLFVNNLTDSRANIFAYGNPFTFGRIGQITPLRPLTVGLSFGLVW
jgi:iron complex outermembrane receptor protein